MNKTQMSAYISAKIYGKEGFSVNAKGNSPKEGFMSGFNHGEYIEKTDEIQASTVDAWVEKHFEELKNDANLYAGGWEDGKTGLYYLEISRNIGLLDAAIDFATKHQQLAIWDVKNNEEIGRQYFINQTV